MAVLAVPILITPWLVYADAPIHTGVLALLLFLILLKIWDAHVAKVLGLPERPIRAFLFWMVTLVHLVSRRQSSEPVLPAQENLARLAMGLFRMTAGVVMLFGFFVVDWSTTPFWLEHLVKAPAFFIGIVGLFQVIVAIARLTGAAQAREPCHDPLVSATPAEFWRRYNRIMGQFLYENVYRRVKAGPLPAVLLTFLFSGLMHEYCFAMATHQVTGNQIAFFMIHGLAVAATQRLKLKGWKRSFGWSATLAFNISAGLLFLADVDRVIPGFYANELPFGLGE